MGVVGAQRESLGRLAEPVADQLATLTRTQAVRRLWARDSSLWPADEAGRREISQRLGWLDSPQWLASHAPEIEEFAAGVQADQLTDVVLFGMGGSSLAPEVLERVVGAASGKPRFAVLDSTDPAAVATTAGSIDLRRTLFIVASKSGSTVETVSHYRFFRARVDGARPADAGRCFVAITDEGSSLDALASREGFRKIFRNPADIGGRYSALSYFGMVPASLMGQDLRAYAAAARDMAEDSRAEAAANSSLRLAALLAGATLAGADKLTLLISNRLRPLGAWIEQLVAESTGKDGRGILPVEGEPRGQVFDYGADRCFAWMRLAGEQEDEIEQLAANLERSGCPLIEIELPNVSAIAGEFLRWEAAVALAGSLLGINPFDQPDVQESKERTTRILSGEGSAKGSLQAGNPRFRIGTQVEIHAGDLIMSRLKKPDSAGAMIDAFLGLARPGGYLALLTYIARTERRDDWASGIRRVLRAATGLPVLHGYGPRYLHSIGQLYKGGPPCGLFLQVTHAPLSDLPIPRSSWTFGVLEAAQAQGDLEALEARGKPALRFHLTGDVDAGLAVVEEIVSAAVSRTLRTASLQPEQRW